jgi:hypothetical protein
MANEEQETELRMNPEDLYQEEVFTDRRMGSIQRLTPVTKDGSRDDQRSVLYVGTTQIMTPAGTLPLQFELDADSLGSAAEKFGDAAQKAAEEMMQRLRELSRERASSIVTPDSDPNSFGGLGGGGGLGGQGGAGGGLGGLGSLGGR